MKHIKLLLICCLFGGIHVFAQETFTCGLPDKLTAVYAAYPDLERDQQELLERSRAFRATLAGDREETYIIPVVFHIIHQNGVENISDEQVFDQMEILNRDYRKRNADTLLTMDEFKPIAADAKIEFRLANVDPFGNCTNGIEHIYSHETNNGDDYSKLNQWPRTRYLNVWVVASMRDGVAGYAYYPSAVATGLHYADGIIILHNYIGSIGTSSAYSSRALTHEIGHWLGLPHTWGNTNSPEVACGDDGIEDTPVTAGHTTCELVDTDHCEDGVAENVQNYMEYSYCSTMFTEGQADVMTLTLETPISGRNNLHTDLNKTQTGIEGTPELCTPLPDFFTTKQFVCEGNSTVFKPSVSRAPVSEYSWHFVGGTPEYSTEISPTVSYANPGMYDVSLTVTNAAGSETTTKTNYVNVIADYWQHEGPFWEDFENDHFYTNNWIVVNPEDDGVKWELTDAAGASGNSSVALKYYKADPDPFLEPHYYARQGGSKDYLVSPSYNISQTTEAALQFKYSYATINSGVFDPQDLTLKVYYRKNCDDTWYLIKNIKPSELACVGYVGTAYYPGFGDNWELVNIPLPEPALATSVRFMFEFIAEDNSNNFFIDDINLAGVLSNGESDDVLKGIQIYPNPTQDDQNVTVSYYSPTAAKVDVLVYDLVGNLIFSDLLISNAGINKHNLNLSTLHLSKGVYSVVLKNETGVTSEKLILN